MEHHKNEKISTPQAIIVAGVLIMVAILLTNKGAGTQTVKAPKTLSEQVGVSKEDFAMCTKNTDAEAMQAKIKSGVDLAMSGVPSNERGTPYSVILGLGGVKTQIRGSESYTDTKKLVDDALLGKSDDKYTGNLPPITAEDHIYGNPDAEVKIVEYSDFECPYCKAFNPTLKRIVTESNGHVAWVYRHWPLHQHSLEKLIAAECVAKLAGNDAFWKYGELLFGLLKTGDEDTLNQL